MRALLFGVVAIVVLSALAVIYFSFKTLVSANAKEGTRLSDEAKRRKPKSMPVEEKVRGAGASD